MRVTLDQEDLISLKSILLLVSHKDKIDKNAIDEALRLRDVIQTQMDVAHNSFVKSHKNKVKAITKARDKRSEKILTRLRIAISQMEYEKIKITKSSLSDYAKITRPTISKYWSLLMES